MLYNVYIWDFVYRKKVGECQLKTNDQKEAMEKAKEIALNYCQDEKPRKIRTEPDVWFFDTDCDFGSAVFGVEQRKMTRLEGVNK